MSIDDRIKGVKKALKEQIFSQDGYVNYTHDMQAKFIELSPEHRLLVAHSIKRANKDRQERQRSIKKIEKHIGSTVKGKLAGVLRKSYVKVSKDSVIELDLHKFEDLAKFDGYFGLQTNVKTDNVLDILRYYHGLWQVEQTFRLTKHNLKIRPVYHFASRRIKVHFALCYASLAVIRTLEFIIKQANLTLTVEHLNTLLREVKMIKIVTQGELHEIATDWPLELKPLYTKLGSEFGRRQG